MIKANKDYYYYQSESKNCG